VQPNAACDAPAGTPNFAVAGRHRPLRLADDVERCPRLGPEFCTLGQFAAKRLARGHDHAELGVVLPGDVSEFNAVHAAGQIHVRQQQRQAVGEAPQNLLGGLRTIACDHVEITFLQQQTNHFPLYLIDFNDECLGAEGHRLSHLRLHFHRRGKAETTFGFGSNSRKSGNSVLRDCSFLIPLEFAS
jgi:hypothetical protein